MSRKKRILIIDDNRSLVKIAEGVLGKEGYETVGAADGEEGLKTALEGRFDLVLLDIVMPGMDGYEVCRRLKADERTKNIPIIFLTSKGNTYDDKASDEDGLKDIDMAFACGADDFLKKPIAASDLVRTVKNVLWTREIS